MSKSVETVSGEGPEESQDDSVFDFLYCDSSRIGSFLAQFDKSGHLKEVRQREAASKGRKGGFELTVGGGASLAGTGGSGNLGFKRGPSEEGSEASERVYDPLWANALTFLDSIAGHDLIADDIAKAGIGQFIKVTGLLKVIDLSIVKRILESPIVIKKMTAPVIPDGANRQQRQRIIAKHKISETAEIGMAMASIFSMTTQATIIDKKVSVWCSLRDEYLTVTPADLLLQHGLNIEGRWTIVGILDAKPGREEIHSDGTSPTSLFADALTGMIPTVRNMLGRPNSFFGITPLLILREILK